MLILCLTFCVVAPAFAQERRSLVNDPKSYTANFGAHKPQTTTSSASSSTSPSVAQGQNATSNPSNNWTAAAPASEQTEQSKSGNPFSGKDDALKPNGHGVQTRFPAVAKIIGRTTPKVRDGMEIIPIFYGTGTYLADFGAWGIVVTNWHVVSESDDSIDVVFPGGVTPAMVVLKDEVWDLAALAIRKPINIKPVPISLDVPKVKQRFWSCGYGYSARLDEFRIQGGELLNYGSLVDASEAQELQEKLEERARITGKQIEEVNIEYDQTSATALYETMVLATSARRGDSGGPVLNCFGEVAGILWGSDSHSTTMATTGVRLQAFLTQAIQRAECIQIERWFDGQSQDQIVSRGSAMTAKDAQYSELSMYDALEKSRFLPISSQPIYVSGDGLDTAASLRKLDVMVANRRVYAAADAYFKRTGVDLPPYPPIFSTTFVSQQRCHGKDQPETYLQTELDERRANAYQFVKTTRAQTRQERGLPVEEQNKGVVYTNVTTLGSQVDDEEKDVKDPANGEMMNADFTEQSRSQLTIEPATLILPNRDPEKQSVSESAPNSEDAKTPEELVDREKNDERMHDVNAIVDDAPEAEEELERNGRSLTYLQAYILLSGLFLCFCLGATSKGVNKKKRNDKRHKREKKRLRVNQ